MVTKLWAAQLESMELDCVINGCKKRYMCACERKDFIQQYSPASNTRFYNVLYYLVLQKISQQHIVNEQTILQHTQEPINHKTKHCKYKNHRACCLL